MQSFLYNPQSGVVVLDVTAILKPDLDENLQATAQRVMKGKFEVHVPYLEEVCTQSTELKPLKYASC